MSNHTGKFLTQWQMAEAKRSEAIQNAVQKREGTNHPSGNIIAWGCGCCIGSSLKRDMTIATPQEAAAILKARKHTPYVTDTHEQDVADRAFYSNPNRYSVPDSEWKPRPDPTFGEWMEKTSK